MIFAYGILLAALFWRAIHPGYKPLPFDPVLEGDL